MDADLAASSRLPSGLYPAMVAQQRRKWWP